MVSAAARRVDVGTHGDAPGDAGWDALAQTSPVGPASTGRKVRARGELHGRDAEGRSGAETAHRARSRRPGRRRPSAHV